MRTQNLKTQKRAVGGASVGGAGRGAVGRAVGELWESRRKLWLAFHREGGRLALLGSSGELLEPKTQNPKPKILNPKGLSSPKTQNPKSKTQTQNPEPDACSQTQGLGSYNYIIFQSAQSRAPAPLEGAGLLARLSLALEPAALSAATLAAGKCGAQLAQFRATCMFGTCGGESFGTN